MSISGQREIQKLLEKNLFKVVNLDKIVLLKEVVSNIKVFNSSLFENMKDLCIDKVYEKSCLIMPVIRTYSNDEKKNLIPICSLTILGVNKSIDFCFAAIIEDNDNNNE